MHTIKLITWNINSLLVRRILLLHMINKHSPDIILLQEIRVSSLNQIKIQNIDSYPYMYFSLHPNKGYAGVGILSKHPLKIVYEYEARVLIAYSSIYNLYVSTVYMYNGFSTTAPLEKKILLFETLLNIYNQYNNIIIGGDMNVCHDNQCNIYDNPYTQQEKDILSNFEQIYEPILPNHKEKYITWWDYRQQAFQKNAGFGLDKFLVKLENKHISSLIILKEYRGDIIQGIIPSDHAPLLLNLQIL